MLDIILFVGAAAFAYITGTLLETAHYRSIQEREYKYYLQPTASFRSIEHDQKPYRSELVTGSAVISLDYFKRILAALQLFFGGNVSAYESLIDRARREAVLRMRQSADNASIILNIRIETSAIGNSANLKKQIGSVEAIAYGTAVWFDA